LDQSEHFVDALDAREVAAFSLAAADELEDLSEYAGMISAQMM
jgi:hypothetical protein